MDLIKLVSGSVSVPVIANGGARGISDFLKAFESGASAVAASSTFIFKNNNTESILINYPSESNLIDEFYSKLNYT